MNTLIMRKFVPVELLALLITQTYHLANMAIKQLTNRVTELMRRDEAFLYKSIIKPSIDVTKIHPELLHTKDLVKLLKAPVVAIKCSNPRAGIEPDGP